MGRCFWLKVYEIPEGDKTSKGRALQNMIQIPSEDNVRAIIDVKSFDDEEFVNSHYILLCTKQGIINKSRLKDFSRPRQNGINAITIREGDQLFEAKLTDGNCEIMMAVKSGRAIRFTEEKVRPTGRGGIGVAGIEVDNEKDEVVGMICVNKNDKESTVLVVSANGYGKRTFLDDPETGENNYRITNRGGKGVKTINVTAKTGSLVGLLAVTEAHDLMITCVSGITIRMPVSQISEQGRATQGVKLIKVDEGDEIAAITKLAEKEEDEDDDITKDATQNESESSNETDIDSTES